MSGEAKTDGEVLMDAVSMLRGKVEVAAARKDATQTWVVTVDIDIHQSVGPGGFGTGTRKTVRVSADNESAAKSRAKELVEKHMGSRVERIVSVEKV